MAALAILARIIPTSQWNINQKDPKSLFPLENEGEIPDMSCQFVVWLLFMPLEEVFIFRFQ